MAAAGQWRRILWLDRQIREGRKPSLLDIQEEFECSRRTALNTVAFLRESLHAPVEYRKALRGYVYTEPTFALPAVFLREGELLHVEVVSPHRLREQVADELLKVVQRYGVVALTLWP